MADKKTMISKLGFFVTHHPWWVIVFSIICIAGLSVGAKNLEFKSDYRVYFSDDNPQLLAFEALQNTYSKSDNVLFVIETANQQVFSNEVLAAIIELTKKSWQIPYSSRVDSITNYQHTVAEGDDLIVGDLVPDNDKLTAEKLAAIKQIAINEPLLVNRLISKTGHVSAVNVTIQLPEKDSMEFMEVSEFSRKIATDIETKYPNIKLHISGIVMMSNAFTEASLDDNATLVPIMYALVILVLLACLRSFTGTFTVILLIVVATAASMGAMGWYQLFLTPTSAIAPIIILTLIVADCVHLLITILQKMRLGEQKIAAIQESIRINFQPICLTSITTAIGFLSMNFSDAPPFRDLGNVVATGAILALLLTVTLLPALLSVLPIRVKIKVIVAQKKPTIMQALAKFVIARYKWLLALNSIIAIVFVSFLPMNQLNDDFVKYFDKTISFRTATDFLNENLGGIYTIQYSIDTGIAGGINEPKFLHRLEEFSQWLKLQPEVLHVNTISDTYKRLNKSMHGDDPEWYKLPEARELAAQYLLIFEMSLPYGLDMNNQINMDKSGTRLIITLKSLSSNELLALESRFSDFLTQKMPNATFVAASTDLMFANIGQRNIIRMIQGTAIALVLISVILMFAFKSIRLGLISLIPNLVPAGISFGIWGVVNGNVGIALSIVTGITLGIVVDDTVHFMSKYQRARIEDNLDKKQAIEYAFSTVGTALWVTSLVLVCGFLVLSFSHFAMNSEMGLMVAITIAIALFLDLLFLPPLLMSLDKLPHRKRTGY